MVEDSMMVSGDKAKKKEIRKKDVNSLCLIHQTIDGAILDRIADIASAREAREMIKFEFKGSSRVVSVRRQSLRQIFETLQIGEGESIMDYLSRMVMIVNQIKAIGYTFSEEEVVSKMLCSLSSKWDFVAVAIEESKDIENLFLQELSGSLQAHEVGINRTSDKVAEKVQYVKGESSGVKENDKRGQHCHRGSYKAPVRGTGRGRG